MSVIKSPTSPSKFQANKIDIDHMVLFHKTVVRMQAIARTKLQMNRLKNTVEQMKNQQQLEKKQDIEPEEIALKEFTTQLKGKKMTPEAFFRVCDTTHSKLITKDQFKASIDNMGLKLTATQFQRLCIIFDEDLGGTISLEEWQHTLETYKLAQEKHVNPEGGQHISFESKTADMIQEVLNNKGMTASQLFDACDADKNSKVSIKELTDTLSSLKPSISLKEVKMLTNFLDIEKDGELTKSEFLDRIQKAAVLSLKKKPNNLFDEDEGGAGDQALPQAAPKKPVAGQKQPLNQKKNVVPDTSLMLDSVIPGFSKMSPRSKAASAVSLVIKQISEKKINIATVYRLADPKRTISVTCGALKQSFIKIATSIDQNLIQQAMLSFGPDSAIVSEQVFNATFNSQIDEQLKPKQGRPNTAGAVARLDQQTQSSVIIKLVQALQKQGITPDYAFKQADADQNQILTLKELQAGLQKWIPDDQIAPADLKLAMITLDVNRTGMISAENFKNVIQQYASNIEVPNPASNNKETPRFQQSTVVQNNQPSIQVVEVDYSEFDILETVTELEKLVKMPVEQVIFDYLEQHMIGTAQLLKLFQKPPNQSTPKDLIMQLAKLCDVKDQKVQIALLVRQIGKAPGKHHNRNNIKIIANSIQDPVLETIEKEIIGHGDGISIEEFSAAFSNIGLNKWQLVCVFYSIAAIPNAALEYLINFEQFVKLMTSMKDKKQQPAPAVILSQNQPQKQQPSITVETGTKPVINKPDASEKDAANNYAVICRDLNSLNDEYAQIDKLVLKNPVENSAEVNALMFDFTKLTCDTHVDSTIMQLNKEFWAYSKFYDDLFFVEKLIARVEEWIDTYSPEADTESECVLGYLFKYVHNELERDKQIKEQNTLMFRVAFSKCMDKQNKPFFTVFQVVALQMLLTERERYNVLCVDEDFLKKFADMKDVYDEPDEKKDFNHECWMRLNQRLQMTKNILAEGQYSSLHGTSYPIRRQQTWQCVRFCYFVSLLIDVLNQGKNKETFLKAFTDSADQRLTYFEFRQVVFNVGFQPPIDKLWFYEDLEDHLDMKNDCTIDLYYVQKFLALMGCNLNATIIDQDYYTGAHNRDLLAQSPEEYQFTDRDYWNGCKTILNSETAALKVAQSLFAECEKTKAHWLDVDFGPKDANDKEGSRKACYFEETIPRGYPDPENMEWMRPSEFLNQDEKGMFLKGDASANDVKQGLLGDCWFIGALSVIATQDELIRGGGDYMDDSTKQCIDQNTIQLASKGVFPPIFHKFRIWGIWVMKFYKSMKWRYVIIDERMPTQDGQLVYAHCTDEEELWVPLIEKAYAKLFGCYQSLTSGNIDEALSDMTALVCEKKDLNDASGHWNQDDDEFWEYLKNLKRYFSLMGCSRSGGTEHGVIIDGCDTGIISGHAYGIINIFELLDPNMENPRKTHRMLQIRNPWGKGEWSQKWSPESATEELVKYKDLIAAYVDSLEDEEKFDVEDENDGTFLINYQNFRMIYNKFFAVVDFDEDWSAVRYESAWDKDSAGGLPLEGTPEANIRFAKNPQYLIESPEQDLEIFVSLTQEDGRVNKNGVFVKYPFKENNVVLMLQIFELPKGIDRITQFVTPVFKTKPQLSNETSLRITLLKGKRYVIVPANKVAGKEAKFFLSLFWHAPLSIVNLKRVDKFQRCGVTKKWKKDWIKYNTIDFVVRKNDVVTQSLFDIKTQKTIKTPTKQGDYDEDESLGDQCLPPSKPQDVGADKSGVVAKKKLSIAQKAKKRKNAENKKLDASQAPINQMVTEEKRS